MDHIPSKGAYKRFLENRFDYLQPHEMVGILNKAPSVVIPTKTHRKYSETYGGRNSKSKQQLDASNLEAAVKSNVEAMRAALLEDGFSAEKVDAIKSALLEMIKAQIGGEL